MAPIKKCKVCGKPFSGEGDVGPTCAEHAGLVGRYYQVESGTMDPDQFIYLKELCDLAEDYGRSRYWMVKLTGGDAGINPPHSPEFTIHIFKNRKCCRREAIATMRELAQQKP